MNLSIIIVSWNTAELLANCLESVYAHPPPDSFELIVVDNASTDGTVQMVRQQFPQVKLVANEENVGFAAANNQAITSSSGRYVLLLNPDTEVRPGALDTLVQFMDAHPGAGAVGVQLLNPDNTLQPSCYPLPTLSREWWRLFHLDRLRPYGTYRMTDWPLDQPKEVEVIQGAALLLRRQALDQVGLLDTDYFIYTEEVDLCYRLQHAGWRLYWVPQAQVVHYGGQSTRQVAAEMFLQLYLSKLLFFRKHHGRLAALIYKLILSTAALIRLLVTPLAWLEQPPRRRQHLALAANYRRLLRSLPGL
jgi:GT2 family glycosyltransferase